MLLKNILSLTLMGLAFASLTPKTTTLLHDTERFATNDSKSSQDFLDGDGTENNPFLISTKYHFDNIRKHTDSYFKLVANIKFLDSDFEDGGAFYNSGNLFSSIGSAAEPFTGHLIGNGFSVDNIHLLNSRGIFDTVNGSTFTSINITNVTYIGRVYDSSYNDVFSGIFCAESNSAVFTNCIVSGKAQSCSWTFNGLPPTNGFGAYCGKALDTKFDNCINNVDIDAIRCASAGGFAGYSSSCTYVDCTNNGNIKSVCYYYKNGQSYSYYIDGAGWLLDSQTIGGIAAYDLDSSSVINCTNNGNIISGDDSLDSSQYKNKKTRFSSGGLFGYKRNGNIRNCINYGDVSGCICVGGLVGLYDGGVNNSVQFCANYGSISSVGEGGYSGGIIGYHNPASNGLFKIQFCANHGLVTSISSGYVSYSFVQGAGGICGYFGGGAASSITNVYNVGAVRAYCSDDDNPYYAGGVVGIFGSSNFELNCSYSIGFIGDASYEANSSHAILGKTLYSSGSISGVYALEGCCSNDNLYDGAEGGMLSAEELSNEQNFDGFDFKTVWFIDPFNSEYKYPQLMALDISNITKVTVSNLNEAALETVEGVDPSFENVFLKLENAAGDTKTIPFSVDYIHSGYDVNNVSIQHIKAKYAGIVSDNELELNVVAKSIVSIEIQSKPSKTTYLENMEEFDATGGSVKVNYDNGSSDIVDLSECSVSGFDNGSIGTKTITVSYAGLSCDFTIVVFNLSSIEISTMPEKTNYVLGQPKAFSTGKLKLNYSHGTSETVALDNSMCSYDESATGVVAVTVEYGGKTTSFDINVSDKVVDHYEIFSPTKTSYDVGEELDLSGGYIRIVYVSEDDYTVEIPLSEATVSGFDSDTAGVKTISVQYETISDSFVVIVKEAYTVTFLDYDGTVISSATYHYGDAIIVPQNPVMPSNNIFDYEFVGWDKEVSLTCYGNATYTAQYAPKFIEYTVTFYDEDGTVISTNTYHYGDDIIAPSNPTKPSDDVYDYTFSGWDKNVGKCTGNAEFWATYTKQYSEAYIKYQSGVLRDQLISEIEAITDIDMSTYATIAGIQMRMENLIPADKAIVEEKLEGLIERYNSFIDAINSEFDTSEHFFDSAFFGIVAAASGLACGFALILKRRF